MAGADLPSFHGIIGRSAAMQALFAEIEHFAPVDVPILIRGESGTGKELVAKAIQRLSGRRERPFETLNCADLTRELLRSELFGHERGAFTGAVSRTAGSWRVATAARCSWTRSASCRSDAQAMLLRFLQEGEGRPVGAAGASRSTCASSRRPIAISRRRWSAARSARTSTTGSGGWCSRCRPCARAARTSRSWWSTSGARSTRRAALGLDITGVSRDAMAILEGATGPGTCASWRRWSSGRWCAAPGWVTPEDIVLPRLRRGIGFRTGRGRCGIRLTPVQEQALQLKAANGEVRRADLVARCRVSHEVARRALAGLARLGLLRRVGLGRATRYVSLSFWLTFLDDAAELVLTLV